MVEVGMCFNVGFCQGNLASKDMGAVNMPVYCKVWFKSMYLKDHNFLHRNKVSLLISFLI